MIVAYSRLFITSYFSTYSGSFNIPVTCLLSPDKEYMVREADEKFIECLKHEMLENRTCDVAPIVATVRLSDDEQFDMKHTHMILLVVIIHESLSSNSSRKIRNWQRIQHFPPAESPCMEDCQLSKLSILLIGIIVLRNLPAR